VKCGDLIEMSWQDILKSVSQIRTNWRNSKTSPDMYYYDTLNADLKKEFDEIFEEMINDIQMGYVSGKVDDGVSGSHATENMQGKFYLIDKVERNGRIAQFTFQIAPIRAEMDKYGRFREYYLYFRKHLANEFTHPAELSRGGLAVSPEDWDNLMETILNVKR
tara:strand:- start:253 stop:741 length:489 start_codon:yes stop_codon:yes gene_type:complete